MYLLAAVIVLADQASKAWMNHLLADGRVVSVFPGLAWELAYNNGAAFGTLEGANLKMAAAAVLAVGLILYWSSQPHPPVMAISLGALLGGAVGNLIDRVRLGYVIDFIAIRHDGRTIFPNFNVADSAITVGACLLALTWYLTERDRERRRRAEATTSGEIGQDLTEEISANSEDSAPNPQATGTSAQERASQK
jgi:signal peptidase II